MNLCSAVWDKKEMHILHSTVESQGSYQTASLSLWSAVKTIASLMRQHLDVSVAPWTLLAESYSFLH